MSKNKIKDPLAEVTEEEETQIAQVQSTEVVNMGSQIAMPATAFNDAEGEFDADDLRTQYLSLVAKTADLADTFGAGSFVLNKEVKIGNGKDPADITILSIKKHFEELVPFGEDITPRIFDKKEDATAAGYSVHWEAKQRVGPVLTCRILLEVPEGFGMSTFEDKEYAEATWVLQKTAYKSAALDVIKARSKGHLKDGLWKGGWGLTSSLKTGGNGSWYVPVLKKDARHTDEFVKWVETEIL